jgi:acetylornithine deacetylase/succinyl-diaminopimelate desuccinylase-like protein
VPKEATTMSATTAEGATVLRPAGPATAAALAEFATAAWDERIVPALADYIGVPAKSPMFDPRWAEHGLLERVVRDAALWIERRRVPGLAVEVIRLPGRTPLLWFELPASGSASGETVLLYGHLDKQPEFEGWRSGFGPWTPRCVDGRLYGRGGADDGYAVYAAVTALEAIGASGLAHPRCVGLVETSEESGSPDLPAYLDALGPRLGRVGLVVCLDSGAGDYERLWLTTSLRGLVVGTLKVEILTEGVHSGDASGVVPSSFRILREVLDRLEDARTGRLLPAEFHCEIPPARAAEAALTAAALGDSLWKSYPFVCGADGACALPMGEDAAELLLNRTWRPALAVTGVDGMPALGSAGNVLRPYTAFKLSLRLPPVVDGHAAALALKRLLEDNAPYRARVTFTPEGADGALGASGWNAPPLAPWLQQALDAAATAQFGAPVGFIGQGGTIPLMGMLAAGFPRAQMMVCGVLGPKSNAHGPNEFLDVRYAKRLTAAVAQVIAACP